MSIYFEIAHWMIISALITSSFMPSWTLAQSAEDTWVEPLNLSHSGAAKNPSIMVDSVGTVHAVWQDEFANFVYAWLDDNQWSAPQRTDLHLLFGEPASQGTPAQFEDSFFTSTNPLFIAGPGEFISAVWVNQQDELYASRVPNSAFNDVVAWDAAQFLSASVTTFAAAVDSDGEVHVAFMSTEDDTTNPAGIYYVRSGGNGLNWSAPALLYTSPYLRALDNVQANVGLTTAGTADMPLVYVVWDNRPRKQIFLAKSMDGGGSWDPAMQVAGPVPDSGLDGPFDIRVGAKDNNIVLVWQSGQPEGTCTQFFQSSRDAGFTWSEAQLMFDDLSGCAQTNEFATIPAADPGGVLLLVTNKEDQVYLSVWNGFQWSEPQAQLVLSGFEDPEIYTQVEYDCHRAALFGEQLYIVGCDGGGGGDIWVTSRDIESMTSLFSPPVWSQPVPVTSDSLEVEAVDMIATGDNLIHAFFSQREDSSIYYTRWDGTTWSRFAPVLELPNGEAGQPAIATGQGDELFLIATNSTGSLYFSRANSREAITPSGWSTPVRLPIAHDGRISPADVAWDAGGTVYIAYSVPVNDERGVYLIQSKDRGETWSEPLQVFNGAAAGFEVVSSPSLHVSANGFIYIMWTQDSIPVDGVSQSLSLYFARSEDSGHSFGKAERVVEAPVTWREFKTDSKGNLHRFWQRLDIMKTLWDQVSSDGGYSWQRAERFPSEEGIAAVTVDSVGRLHLVDVGHGTINHWLWDGSRWQAEAPTRWSLASQDNRPVELLAASVNMNGKIVVILVVPAGSEEAAERRMFYITRTFYLPPIDVAIQETLTQLTPLPTRTTITTPTESISPTATTFDTGSPSPQGPAENTDNNTTSLLAEVILPLSLLLIGVLGVLYLRAVWSRSG